MNIKDFFSLTIFLLLFNISKSYSQDEIKLNFSKDGFTPLVIPVDSLKAEDIYKKSKEWIINSFINPNIVITVDEKPEKLRVNAVAKNAYSIKTLGMRSTFDVDYLMDIEIKDFKVRTSINIISVYFSNGKGKFPVNEYYKADGELRNSYKDLKPTIEATFNKLIQSLIATLKTMKNDW